MTSSPGMPFLTAGPSEILARVCYQYIKLKWRHRDHDWHDPASFVASLAQDWRDRDPPIGLAFWLVAYAAAIKRNITARDYLQAVIERSRVGYSYRACALFEYKDTRRRDPRVTNRGVSSRARRRSGGR